MMPMTHNKMAALTVVSALQKHIRRGEEVEAMLCASELLNTSKAFCTMLCNRLEIICHEDLDTAAAPHVFPFVAACIEMAKRRYDPKKTGPARIAIGNALRMMCRSPKSREGCHFDGAYGLGNILLHKKPTLPDYIYDVHTSKGKRLGRDLAHFRADGALLVPARGMGPQPSPNPLTGKDVYEDVAYEVFDIMYNKPGADNDTTEDEQLGLPGAE